MAMWWRSASGCRPVHALELRLLPEELAGVKRLRARHWDLLYRAHPEDRTD